MSGIGSPATRARRSGDRVRCQRRPRFTDHYELTMLRSPARQAGTADRACVFEMFARRLPPGRRYGVVAGVGRALRAIPPVPFRRGGAQVSLRSGRHRFPDTADWLADYRFTGDIWGYPEGEMYFPGSPIPDRREQLRPRRRAGDGAAQHLQPRLGDRVGRVADDGDGGRSSVHRDGQPADPGAGGGRSRASRLHRRLRGDLQSRGRQAVSVCRPAARRARFHAAARPEQEAFAAQLAALGEDTTLLVDTYDVFEAVRPGVELTGGRLGAVRLDSGDLGALASQVRELLASSARTHQILVTSDLDEFTIAALAAAPVDGYGVGTALVTGSGHPTSGFVYKLVARAGSDTPGRHWRQWPRRARTRSRWAAGSTPSAGCLPTALRNRRRSGSAPGGQRQEDRELLVRLVEGGEIVGEESLAPARERHRPVPGGAATGGNEDVPGRAGDRDRARLRVAPAADISLTDSTEINTFWRIAGRPPVLLLMTRAAARVGRRGESTKMFGVGQGQVAR